MNHKEKGVGYFTYGQRNIIHYPISYSSYPYLLKIYKVSLRNTLIYFKSFLKLSNLKIITNLYIILYHRNVIFKDENNLYIDINIYYESFENHQ